MEDCLWLVAIVGFILWLLRVLVKASESVVSDGRKPAPDDEESESETMNSLSFSSIDDPLVNIDGTPMVGSCDLRGNPYGITHHNDFRHGVGNDFP